MKSSVIISLYGNYNYGNKLQNYALQEALSSIGGRSEVLWYEIQ